MSTPEILSIVAAVFGIVGTPISMYFSWKAAQKAGQAVAGADELAKRVSGRGL